VVHIGGQKVTAVKSNAFKVTRYFFGKIRNGPILFKALLLTGKVTAPD